MAKTLRKKIRDTITSKSGIVVSDDNLQKLTHIIGRGICRILAREGHITLDKVGKLEYEVIAKKEVRFANGLPVVMPIKSKFRWNPSEELRKIIEMKTVKKLGLGPEHLGEIFEYLSTFREKLDDDKNEDKKQNE